MKNNSIPIQKHLRYYKNCYLPSSMTEGAFDEIELMRIVGAKVPSLKKIIYDFPMEFMREALASGKSILQYCKEQGIDPAEKYPGELEDVQTTGVGFLYLSKRSILGDKPGAGKTVMIAGLLNLLKRRGELKRFVLFAQPNSRLQLLLELIRFTGMNIMTLETQKNKLLKGFQDGLQGFDDIDGIVMTHSALRSDTLQLELTKLLDQGGLFDTVIIDESYVLKNKDSKTYRYTENIVNMANRVHLMNATVFERKLMDIYNQVAIIDSSVVPTESHIKRYYCSYSPKSFYKSINGVGRKVNAYDLVGYKNQSDFKNKLKAVYFGRSYEELGYQNKHEYKVDYVYVSKEQKKALDAGYVYMMALNDIQPYYMGLPEDSEIKTTHLSRIPKAERLIQLITNEYQGMKVVVYCWYLNAQYRLRELLLKVDPELKVGILNGETPHREHEAIKDSFNQENSGLDVLITNAQNALNLNTGQVAIIYTPLFTSAKTEQFVARINRDKGKTKKIFHLLLYRDSEEFNFFKGVVVQRSKDGSDLIQEDITPVDRFNQVIEEMESVLNAQEKKGA